MRYLYGSADDQLVAYTPGRRASTAPTMTRCGPTTHTTG